ncbi:non-homologous end-joining factor 1 isoform X1 [Nilaparvata lugens]|uniref:non-homologous end-joining factor 1 isoform X1 n=1 Tax=Nilaparvata lugens TaxID=108931 RepID=UPI00193DF607|nr:non-homologous end-joining factor 1 isoform X1 [Nilaparvata lugens]XP_022201649.2 non-homologous end-joining factor 1 isoform X1 [Nilaparvata lugens]XP_039290529.1 non-homologous end-joining factor 1 isoform X1 [Nilaparvata lugens]
MWKQIIIDEKLYLLRNSKDGSQFHIYITDLLKIWIEDLSEDKLLQRCKDMNPLYEASSEILIQRIKELVELESSDVRTTITESNGQIELAISSYLGGVIFKMKFSLSLGSPEMFFKQMTSPLIRMVEELKDQQNELFGLLNKKDIEIEEYKMSGMKITRKNVETKPFIKEEFLKNVSNEDVQKRRKSICPTTSFIDNCNELYEECSKNIETATETGKEAPEKEQTKGSNSDKDNKSPKKTKSKRGAGIVYEQDNDEDDDETYFSIPNQAASTTSAKKEKSPTKKKRSRIQDMF